MTNGEKIKELFPDLEISPNPYSPSVDIFVGGILMMRVDRNWWNAEYKEPTTKNDLPHCQHTDEEIAKSFIEDVEAVKNQLPTTKNDLGVDYISRQEVLRLLANSIGKSNTYLQTKVLKMSSITPIKVLKMSSVTPQEPRCKECKWWKDSDGEYRRGCGAESQCPINRREVFEGNGYCYLFEPQESKVEE